MSIFDPATFHKAELYQGCTFSQRPHKMAGSLAYSKSKVDDLMKSKGLVSVDRVLEGYARRRTPKMSRQDDSIDYLTTTLSPCGEGGFLSTCGPLAHRLCLAVIAP
jgi:hypothetical protein